MRNPNKKPTKAKVTNVREIPSGPEGAYKWRMIGAGHTVPDEPPRHPLSTGSWGINSRSPKTIIRSPNRDFKGSLETPHPEQTIRQFVSGPDWTPSRATKHKLKRKE